MAPKRIKIGKQVYKIRELAPEYYKRIHILTRIVWQPGTGRPLYEFALMNNRRMVLAGRGYGAQNSGWTSVPYGANKEIALSYGRSEVDRLFNPAYNQEGRLDMLKYAIGRPEQEVRDILTLPDGNVFRHEIDAVMLRLHSSSEAFNEGRNARLKDRPESANPYSSMIDYANYINWGSGHQSTDLAIKLHGKKKVQETL